jgi:hypothetical protein
LSRKEKDLRMVFRVQHQIFNLNFVKHIMKVDSKDGKFFIGVFSTIRDMEFYFEYPTPQKRNEDWERLYEDLHKVKETSMKVEEAI